MGDQTRRIAFFQDARKLSQPLPRNRRKLAQADLIHVPTPTPPPATIRTSPAIQPQVSDTRWSWGRIGGYVLALACLLAAWRPGTSQWSLPIRSGLAAIATLARSVGPQLAPAKGFALTRPEFDIPDTLRREGHVSLSGGVLFLPESFRTDDGSYDLLLHFHGNTAVVKESVEVSELNAAVAVINLGIGSGRYEEAYGVPGTYEELLASIARGLTSRGVDHPRLRRLALSGWSAGYGAISTILQQRRGTDPLDAIVILDGIHCGWENDQLNGRQMKPFVTAAQHAALGHIFFGITHSEIDPLAYASTTATADYLLQQVGTRRFALDPVADAPPYLQLSAMKGAVSAKLEKSMVPTSAARVGNLEVVGYRGETAEHHMAHLFQMAATLLPKLKERWTDPEPLAPQNTTNRFPAQLPLAANGTDSSG